MPTIIDFLCQNSHNDKFVTMVENMDESFLITPSWGKIQKRIKNQEKNSP